MSMKQDEKKGAVILLAEDNAADQEMVRRTLEEAHIRCRLLIVSDGEQALDYINAVDKYEDRAAYPFPDLLMLDINMPRCNGHEVLSKIRKSNDSKVSQLRAIMVSTSSRDSDVAMAYDMGIAAYIIKPLEPKTFVQVIQDMDEFWFDLMCIETHRDLP